MQMFIKFVKLVNASQVYSMPLRELLLGKAKLLQSVHCPYIHSSIPYMEPVLLHAFVKENETTRDWEKCLQQLWL